MGEKRTPIKLIHKRGYHGKQYQPCVFYRADETGTIGMGENMVGRVPIDRTYTDAYGAVLRVRALSTVVDQRPDMTLRVCVQFCKNGYWVAKERRVASSVRFSFI